MLRYVIAATIMFAASPALAHGDFKCDSGDQSTWKSGDSLKALLIKDGWTVRKLNPENGCYEVYGTTPEGQRVEAFFHPQTLEKLLVMQRGTVLFKKDE